MKSLADTAKSGSLANNSHAPVSLVPLTQLSSFLTDPSRSAAPSNQTEDESEFDDSDDIADSSVVKHSPKSFSISSPNRPALSPFVSPPKADASFQSSRRSSQDMHSQDFQNSSFMNDTKAQFDLAIDLDDGKFTQNARKLLLWLLTNGERRMSSIRKALALNQPNLGTVDSASTQKHEELAKQLTDCKIQLKLYDKFLQDLIDKKQIDAGDITNFHETWEEKELTVAKLRQENEEMSSLVEDLYASLEESQDKWRQADNRAHALHNSFEDLKEEISKLLLASGIPEKLVQHSDSASYINLAIPLLRSLIDSESSRQEVAELEERIQIYEKEARLTEELLGQQTEEIASWKAKYSALELKVEELQEAVDTTPKNFGKDVEARFEKYEAMIDDLQRQINRQQDSSVAENTDYNEETIKKMNRIRQDYDDLHRLHEDLKIELTSTKESMSSTIKSLTQQLNNRKSEQLALRDQVAELDSVKERLNTAVDKQRLLQSEKTKLSYKVEELNQAKSKLQNNIDVLTEKLQDAHLDNDLSQPGAEEAKARFHQLFEFDIEQLSRLGDTFDRLVDDSSIHEPIEKIRTIKNFLSKSDVYILDYSDDVISDLVLCHKTLFQYFARAADLSVDDHITLLLKREQKAKENDHHIENLQKRILQLENQNDKLSRHVEAGNNDPENKLRLEELTARWKTEREARVYENKLAKRRFKELEEEISRLRDAMGNTTNQEF